MKHAFTARRDEVHLRWQILIFVVAVLVFLYFTGQLTAPFLAGDDWPSLLPASLQGGVALPWANTLAEGRWINYLWYYVSVHLTAKTGNALFTAAYIAMTCTVASLVSNRRLFLLCAFALFFSPMFSGLSLWPNTTFSAVTLCAIAMLALARFGKRFTLPILFVATFVLVMAYPPLASIVLIGAAIKQEKPTVRSNLILAVVFLFAFAASVLSIYGLNALFHGYFGVKVAPWRHPHPLLGIGDLGANLKIAAANWQLIARLYKVPIICAGIAGAGLLIWKQSRARGLSVIFALVVCWCVAVGITVISGVTDPGRSVPWLWVTACFLCALVASQCTPVYRYSGVALLLLLGISGGVFSWHNYRRYRPFVTYVSELGHAVNEYRDTPGGTTLTVAGSISHVPTLRALPGGHWPEPGLKWIMWKQYGVALERCDYVTCTAARKYLLVHGITQPAVLHLDGKPVLALNGYAVEEILRNYPSARQEAALHLAYPIFLRYGLDTVRITPFYPGTSRMPVSVALPARSGGYTLHSEGKSCGYLVDYKLTDTDGNQVGAGQYRTPETIIIGKARQNEGFRLLSLRMASDAKNNYGCNIVVDANP